FPMGLTEFKGLNNPFGQLSGFGFVSRNGRFAQITARSSFADPTPPGLWDLTTHTQLFVTSDSGGPQAITDDGTLAICFSVVKNGQVQHLPINESCESSVIDRAGKSLVF